MSSSRMHSGLPGSIKLFQFLGIDVHLHWAWAFVAYYSYTQRLDNYQNPMWAVAEVLALFGIVLIHEYGHALACRSTGGRAEHIMLWPLGGVAFVQPPMRPGAMLWTSVAGPLVNVVLIPITFVPVFMFEPEITAFNPDAYGFLFMLFAINLILLIFNMLPVYPLDGGQVVRSILWYFVGPAKSLMIAAYLGLVGVAIAVGWAFSVGDWWLGLIALYAGFSCKRGLDEAKRLKYQEPVQRSHAPDMISCPACRRPPPMGPYWQCECGSHFDLPGENGRCPSCERAHSIVVCPYCMNQASLIDWRTVAG